MDRLWYTQGTLGCKGKLVTFHMCHMADDGWVRRGRFFGRAEGILREQPGPHTSISELSIEFHGTALMIIWPQMVMLFVSVLPRLIWISAELCWPLT